MTISESAEPSPPGRPPAGPGAERPVYDLATASADYVNAPGTRPRRTVLVCTHLRSGSTLLGEAMYAAGGLGCPLEYFHPGFRPRLERRWGSNGLAEYTRAVYRHRTDPTGVLGVKLFWRDVEELCTAWQPQAFAGLARELEAAPGEATYRKIHAVLAEVFPNPCFVYLARQDRLRQAISCVLASQTKQWRLIPGLQPVAAGEPVYDYDHICSMYALATYCVTHWEGFFRATGVVPCRVAYEDLVADFPAAVGRLFQELGRSDALVALPRLRRQANRISEEFLLHFLQDFRARQGQGR